MPISPSFPHRRRCCVGVANKCDGLEILRISPTAPRKSPQKEPAFVQHTRGLLASPQLHVRLAHSWEKDQNKGRWYLSLIMAFPCFSSATCVVVRSLNGLLCTSACYVALESLKTFSNSISGQ
eukprot:scaffold122241_cov35-Tisochrysis_lutea.AAC.4